MDQLYDILLTFLADVLFAVLVLVAAAIVLRLRKRRGEVIVRGVLAGICAVIIDKSSGIFYSHERPFVVMGTEAGALNPHNNSFPSDHALLVFAAAFVVWVATKNWRLGLGLLFGGAVVGWARVEALVHWPIDIVGSFVIAGVMVAFWFGLPYFGWMQMLSKRAEQFVVHKLPRRLTGGPNRK